MAIIVERATKHLLRLGHERNAMQHISAEINILRIAIGKYMNGDLYFEALQ
jgi:hypothetical protein